MKPQIITLNIGLNNNPKNVAQILAYFRAKEGIILNDFQIGRSTYNDQIEPTLILKLATNLPLSRIIRLIENTCLILTQECIAVTGQNFSLLVYPANWEGEKFAFSSDYFLNF